MGRHPDCRGRMRSARGDWRLFQPLRAPCACQELLASVAKRACLRWRKRLKSLKPIDGMRPCNSGAEASRLRLRDWMRQPASVLHLRGMQRGCQSNPCRFPVWAPPSPERRAKRRRCRLEADPIHAFAIKAAASVLGAASSPTSPTSQACLT